MRSTVPLLLATALAALACGGTRAVPNGAEDEDKGAISGDLAVQLAETMVQAGAHASAVPILRGALARSPTDPRLHYLMANVLRDRGVYEKAREEYEIALQLAPKMAPAHAGFAILEDFQGNHDAAVKRHLRALELSPQVPRFHNNLGFSYYLAGHYQDAINAYQNALRLEPSAGSVYLNLGFSLAALGRDDEAMKMFKQSLDEGEALNNLALAHELRGDPSQARRIYQEALAVDPTQKQALANLKALGRGKQAPQEEAK